MSKQETAKHYDLMGKEIAAGSFVVTQLTKYRSLELCVVDKINPKMCRIRTIYANKFSGRHFTTKKYPAEMMVIDNEDDITIYILRNS